MKMWAMIIEVYLTILVPCAKNEFVPYGFALWVCAIGGFFFFFKHTIFFYQVYFFLKYVAHGCASHCEWECGICPPYQVFF